MNEIAGMLHTDVITVTGKPVIEAIEGMARLPDSDVIAASQEPLGTGAGTCVLRGNLAPNGAVIKQSAISAHLAHHRGPALVFDTIEEYDAIKDDPDLPVDQGTVLVLKHAGPKGYPGMPEVGNLELPRKLLEGGVRDIVRVSDARMSGTAYGTVVLHVSPEAAVGGPLALVRTGDVIELDITGRRLHLDVPEDELARRRATWSPPHTRHTTGYARLYVEHVLQADRGADLDFLVGCRGSNVPRQSH